MPLKDIGLKEKAQQLRVKVLEMCVHGGGHLVSAFSCLDILVALYYADILRFNPKDPNWGQRDRFILSKGHAAAALYAILADLGVFSPEELDNYCKYGNKLAGSHPDRLIPGIEATTGSLGHGLGIAAGMSWAAKLNNQKYKTVVLMGDGECSEGAVWEAALFASKRKLDNLVGIIDRNQLCVMGPTEEYIGLDPLSDKWKAFGWEVVEINGHAFESFTQAFNDYNQKANDKPFMIIAHTIKGKGVSFMENDPTWHTRVPIGEQIELARRELERRQGGTV